MNNSKQNNICNKDEKNNFVVVRNSDICYEEKRMKGKYIKNSNDIVEYTDDVSEYMRSLYAKITINLEEYFQGSVDLNNINEKFRQFFYVIKNYCLNNGLITEHHTSYKCKLLKDIYRSYRHNAVIIANDINDKEGKEFAEKYFGGDTDQFIYYSSDYYYKCDNIRNKLIEIATKLAEDEKIPHFETQSIDNRKRYMYDYEYNYAWMWKHKVNTVCNVDMNDIIIPPDNIKILYHKSTDKRKERKLLICYKGKWVPVDYEKNDLKWEKLNEFLQEMNFTVINNNKFRDFLQDFCS